MYTVEAGNINDNRNTNNAEKHAQMSSVFARWTLALGPMSQTLHQTFSSGLKYR